MINWLMKHPLVMLPIILLGLYLTFVLPGPFEQLNSTLRQIDERNGSIPKTDVQIINREVWNNVVVL